LKPIENDLNSEKEVLDDKKYGKEKTKINWREKSEKQTDKNKIKGTN